MTHVGAVACGFGILPARLQARLLTSTHPLVIPPPLPPVSVVIEFAFNFFDSDGNGSLSLEELSACLSCV